MMAAESKLHQLLLPLELPCLPRLSQRGLARNPPGPWGSQLKGNCCFSCLLLLPMPLGVAKPTGARGWAQPWDEGRRTGWTLQVSFPALRGERGAASPSSDSFSCSSAAPAPLSQENPRSLGMCRNSRIQGLEGQIDPWCHFIHLLSLFQ